MIHYDVSERICVLRLDAPPLNVITFALLDELRAATRRANDDSNVQGIVITGDAGHFSVGADISIFKEIASAEDAVRTSRIFQEAYQEIEDSPKPVVAAVAGGMMGGAVELAAVCHFRVCAGKTWFSMPEVNLGINSGAGGTQRLPRLIGVGPALDMLLTGKPVDSAKALKLGLVDAVCEGGELTACAGEILQSMKSPRTACRGDAESCEIIRTRDRVDRLEDDAARETLFAEAEQQVAEGRPEIIAPRKILEAVKIGLEESFEAGLRKEQEFFADCMATPATQNKIYIFFAHRETGKVPYLGDVKPAEVAKAAVIGMGSMGTGIAHALMIAGVPVVVRDEDDAILEKGTAKITGSIEGRVKQGKLDPERAGGMLKLLATTTDWQEIADADLVIEAVFENTAVKHTVLRRIEDVCGDDAIIASNTSTISLDVLADAMQRPERLIGMHFFNPAHRMPLVEVIRREATPAGVMATALQFAGRIRKTPVLVRNREGFLVNRIFIPYLKEAFWLLEEGADAAAIDAAMVEFGFPMGPLTLIDMAGLDILAMTDDVLRRAFPQHGPLSPVAVRLVERGHLGQKTGAGVYRYEKGDYTPFHSRDAEEIVADVRRQQGRTPRRIDADEITDRLVLRMVSEAFHVVEEGIAQRESDIDAAMVLGTGFPDFRGGVLKYARDRGLDRVAARLEELASQCGRRFSPCELLKKLKGA